MIRYYLITLVVFVLDQISKLWVLDNIKLHEQQPVLSWFNLTHACNAGAAFSFLSNAGGWQRWGLSAFALIVCVVIAVWIARLPKRQALLALALALILGGALGNLWDRVYLGCVVDFIQVFLSFIPMALFNPWPSFNIADSAIFIGAVVYLYDAFFVQPKLENPG